MKQTLFLDIGGARYKISADADEAHVERLAHLINERMQALGPGAARATPAQKLVIIALGLADDLLQAESRSHSLQETTRAVIEGAIERIDTRLNASSPAMGTPGPR
ncbi:MAG: cell division protein ZapA [Myxococcales bacterium]|nr:cell division protein ZapA [Myxococcales bacterium]MCB9709537.1 cell division protein ZapA [Myxococcales bacterium]